MNDKKAKALRKLVGFRPSAEREYEQEDPMSQRIAKGARQVYQREKKNAKA